MNKQKRQLDFQLVLLNTIEAKTIFPFLCILKIISQVYCEIHVKCIIKNKHVKPTVDCKNHLDSCVLKLER